MSVKTYRKKPVEVKAIQYDGKNVEDCIKFIENGQVICWKKKEVFPYSKPEIRIMIETLEGVMQARPGDYIIRGVNGEYYPCKPDIFEKTYEMVKEI